LYFFLQLEKQQQQIAKKNFSKVEHLNQVYKNYFYKQSSLGKLS
jgi:hypothetical protein